MENIMIITTDIFSIIADVVIFKKGIMEYSTKVTMDNLVNVIPGMAKEHEIDKINLCGNADYLSRFKAELSATNYEKTYEINIISKGE